MTYVTWLHTKVVKYAKGRVSVIAGAGSNNTREAIDLTIRAEKAGADAILSVNPYYNKPTQEGLYRHFKKIADNTSLPVILYNIQGRCGVNLEIPTFLRLINDCENIVAEKEASGKIEQIRETIYQVPKDISILSGDDKLTLEVMKAGGKGVISVASNIVPRRVVNLVQALQNSDMIGAGIYQERLFPLFEALFIETNPIPIKYMLSKQGKCKLSYRLPMCEPSLENQAKLDEVMREYTLI